jgi:hypothetical protein
LVILFMVVAIVAAVTADAWASLPDAVTGFGRIPEGLTLALVLPALAFAITIVTIVIMSLLAYSTVFGAEAENNITFLQAEGDALMDTVGTWFGYLFWIIGATSLFAAALGIVDYTCRLVADVLKVSYLRDNETWSESRIYFLLVWVLVVWSAIILLAIQSQPLILLIISASIGGFMMFIYSGLLILTNKRSLPPAVRITGFRTATMVWSVLLFGFASVIAIQAQWDNIKELFGL